MLCALVNNRPVPFLKRQAKSRKPEDFIGPDPRKKKPAVAAPQDKAAKQKALAAKIRMMAEASVAAGLTKDKRKK